MVIDLSEELVEAVRRECERAASDAQWLGVCVNGVHLRAARQVRSTCPRCGQDLHVGNVGPWQHCDDHGRCNDGSYNHQHWCGEWNPPVEVTISLVDAVSQLDDEVSEAIAHERQTAEEVWESELSDEDAEAVAREMVRERAAALVDELLDMLERECAETLAAAADRVRESLREQVRQARADLDAAVRELGPLPPADAETEADRERRREILDRAAILDDPTGGEVPCVFLGEDGRLCAWDHDPASLADVDGYGTLKLTDTIDVGEEDL